MADHIPHQTFQIKDLPTKSVTLYPARAHVVREIRDVRLQPGQNDIEIFGLTADADPNSVQIDGKGAAIITDMTLELAPNKEQFSDVYPSDSESSDDEDDNYEDSDDEIESVKTLSKQIKDVELKIEAATESQKSAERRLKTLDAYSNGITGATSKVKWSATEVADALGMYDNERQELFKINTNANVELKTLRKQKARLESEKGKAGKDEEKRKARELREKEKHREKVRRQKEEKRKEAERAKTEKRKFWPYQSYKITLGLETSVDTPSSSRRNSMDSITLSGVPTADVKGKAASSITSSERTVTLSLSYVVSSAFWTPRYDLSISSQQKTTTIVYRAEFSNGTSETWKDAKIILSTSQTSYSGLDDKAPFMSSWPIKLGRSWENNAGGLLSSAEMKGPRYQNAIIQQASKASYKSKAAPNAYSNNASQWEGAQAQSNASGGLFGQSQQEPGGASLFGSKVNNAPAPPLPPQAPMLSVSAAPISRSHGNANTKSLGFGGFGSSNSSNADKESKRRSSMLKGGLFGGGGTRKEESDTISDTRGYGADDFAAALPDEDDGGAGDGANGLDFEESVWEDNGLTANYELPGIRTLAPSSLARRHKIASINATNIHLSYVCVPKLRSAAFLRAKIRNPSTTVTLLKGTAGVTLDGSFLGNMTLPRVSPSQLFSLPLGVDPAIQISYPKPNVHRSTSGFISKESAQTFNRSIWLTNTKPSAVELLVLDQVPISQDERLRVAIVQPRGLSKEGDVVKAGQAAKEGGKEVAAPTGSVKEGAWGKATASLKKNGEINWNVNLEKGSACLLKLEYETRMPSGEAIVEV
jgi:hypothetical protein